LRSFGGKIGGSTFSVAAGAITAVPSASARLSPTAWESLQPSARFCEAIWMSSASSFVH
jgi:hypothetical protein